MPHDTTSNPNVPQASTEVLRVIEDVTTRRLAGEHVTDEAVIAEHPDLMPSLGKLLAVLRSTERARIAARDSSWRPRRADRLDVPRLDMPLAGSFDGFELHEEIGRGAMAVVYRATQRTTKREVAIKVMSDGPFSGPHDRMRFEQEARILGQLRHPNVVAVHSTGVAADHFYIVMDYINGAALDAHVASENAAVHSQLELFAKICDGVSAAHLQGIIHRDLKPSNIRVDRDGQPHVLDFGLAKTESGNVSGTLSALEMTMTGQFVGSLPWASPEQAEGSSTQIDLRTDVYSLGVILFQMLTRRFPYAVVGNIRDIIDNIIQAEPTRPRSLSVQIDDDIETIVLKSLAKDRDRRYQSAAELARDVRHYLSGEPIEAKRDSGWYVLGKMIRRHKTSVAMAGTLLALLIAFGATMSVMYGRAERQAVRAQQTLSFLQDMLFEASSQRLGPDATLMQVLDAASGRMATEFPDQPEIEAAVQYTIGHAYETIWKKEDAIQHLQASVDLYTKTLGRSHPDTLRSIVHLGMILAEMRDPRSVELQEEALSTRRKLYGEDHVLIANSKNELAFALWTTPRPRQWERAERLYQEALQLFRRHLGNEHADIARSLQAFANMKVALGRHEEAIALYEESLGMSRKLLGPHHQFVTECMGGYANALQHLKRFGEAEAILHELLIIMPERFGKNWIPSLYRRMANLHLSRGDLVATRQWEDRAMEVACRQTAQADPESSDRLNRLADAFVDSRGDDLPPYREALLAIAQRSNDPGEVAESFLDISDLLTRLDRPAEAELLLRQSLAAFAEFPRENRVYSAYVAGLLGECLTSQGKFAEAEKLLLESHDELHAELTQISPAARGARVRLANLYRLWGKPDQAVEYETNAVTRTEESD